MRALFGVLAVVSLIACGQPADDPADVTVGLDEATACPVPSTYCASIGLSWTGCARVGTGNSCWFWAESSQFWVFTNPNNMAAVYYFGQYKPYYQFNTSNCPSYGLYSNEFDTYQGYPAKCRSRFDVVNQGFNQYVEMHTVYNSNCPGGYVECQSARY